MPFPTDELRCNANTNLHIICTNDTLECSICLNFKTHIYILFNFCLSHSKIIPLMSPYGRFIFIMQPYASLSFRENTVKHPNKNISRVFEHLAERPFSIACALWGSSGPPSLWALLRPPPTQFWPAFTSGRSFWLRWFVIVSVGVFWLVRSGLLMTLINCLKGDKAWHLTAKNMSLIFTLSCIWTAAWQSIWGTQRRDRDWRLKTLPTSPGTLLFSPEMSVWINFHHNFSFFFIISGRLHEEYSIAKIVSDYYTELMSRCPDGKMEPEVKKMI